MSSDATAAGPELAPSNLTDDQASFALTVGMTGLFALLIGVLVLILNAAKAKLPFEVGNHVGFAGIVIGLALMFFHAARDADQLVRRLYGYVGGLGLAAAGAILSLLPIAISASKDAPAEGTKPIVSLFFPFGWACFLAGLCFLIPFCRHETEEQSRRYGLLGLGGIGAALTLTGLIGGLIFPAFALTYGPVLALLGLGYLCAYISQLGGTDLDGYRPAIALGLVGAAVFVVALGWSAFGTRGYFVPTGLILMVLGLLYGLVSLFLVSDWPVFVIARRELTSYFYSPIGYLILAMAVVLACVNYAIFWFSHPPQALVPEPVVSELMANIVTIIPVLIIIPVLTMRLVSEEKRTGTYEVLVCAPISEPPIVLGKLFASWVFYMLTWAAGAAVLVAFRLDNPGPFDYRPLLSFYLAVAVTGLAFLSMGLFFSALTKNQIIAAVLTFVGMMVGLTFLIVERFAGPQWKPVWSHLAFLNLWWDSLDGRLHLRDVILQVSVAVFFSYLTIKVLEARRWS